MPRKDWYSKMDNGCWDCTLAPTKGGYCQKWNNGKLIPAHKFSYEQHKGRIPSGMEIDHLCKNVKCVNPEHLEAVTKLENIRRSNVAKLNIKEVSEIRNRYQYGENQTYLAKIYGVGQYQISRIINYKRWQIA